MTSIKLHYAGTKLVAVSLGENTVAENGSQVMFARRLERSFQGIEQAQASAEDQITLQNFASYYGFSLPRFASSTPADAPKKTIIMGAGSNNVELEKSIVTIVSCSPYKKPEKNINRYYFNCVEKSTGSKFVYYIDLKSNKRFYKKDSEPKNYIRLDDMIKYELKYFGLETQEELLKKLG